MRIGVQFAPLLGLRSGHFGLFWAECLGTEEWRILQDQTPSPTETERFGSKALRPKTEKQVEDFLQICMRLSSRDDGQTVHFQANKLICSWNREENPQFTYSAADAQYDKLFGRLKAFTKNHGLGEPVPNLWELTYVNKILPGKLWQRPADWHRVLPGIFPVGGPQVNDHEWATFNGTWMLVIPPQLGRVRIRIQKAVENATDEVVLLLVITARGEIGDPGASDWSSGIRTGHRSAVRAFYDVASPEARQDWGLKS